MWQKSLLHISPNLQIVVVTKVSLVNTSILVVLHYIYTSMLLFSN